MANINFDDGFETFTINGDSNRVIKINPKDGNILIRFDEAMRDLKNESERLSSIKVKADGSPVEQAGISLEESTSRLGEFNQLICSKMDYVFNADVRQAAFGRQSPLSIVGPDNRFLFEILRGSFGSGSRQAGGCNKRNGIPCRKVYRPVQTGSRQREQVPIPCKVGVI